MANGIEQSVDAVQLANELYWSSDESVNQIANQLGMSKGSLYAAIKPKPSDSMCPTCGRQLVYPNRTALQRGTLSCLRCEHQFNVRPERPPERIYEADSEAPVGPPSDARAATGRRASGQLVWGTTLLALGTGLLLSRLVRRR